MYERHGGGGTRLYTLYKAITYRCDNPSNHHYKWYGAKGVKCEWKTFSDFRKDMEESYLKHISTHGERNTTLDRFPNKKGNYNKENCRWATWEVQHKNRTDNVFITYKDQTHTLADWMRITGISDSTIRYRIRKGWSVDTALGFVKKENSYKK